MATMLWQHFGVKNSIMHGSKQLITETNSGAAVGINVSQQQSYGRNLGSRLAEWTDSSDTSDCAAKHVSFDVCWTVHHCDN